MDTPRLERFQLDPELHVGRVPSDRIRPCPRGLRRSDPATRIPNPLRNGGPQTIDVDCSTSDALIELLRAGTRALLVLRDTEVLGLVTADQLKRAVLPAYGLAAARRVGEVMVPVTDLPMIEWDTVQDSNVADVLEIFEATGFDYLVVVEPVQTAVLRIRGLIHHQGLDRLLRASQ